jgi:pimeloyl-ACP methyl ester carboxylesterase
MKLTAPIGSAIAVSCVVAVAAVVLSQLPGIGAGALLFPARHLSRLPPPEGCVERNFTGLTGTLAGWHCRTSAGAKSTIVYLHGIADNRDSAVGVIRRFTARGYDVIAYDSRAHGRSDGDRCTYGFYEKDDLRRVIDQAGATNVVLIGQSLGAAVALQAAAIEPRVRAVVAVSTFSDLRTIATERAAVLFFPSFAIERAFDRTEQDGQFVIDEASPLLAATNIRVPVFLIHGANDIDTAPEHSRRVFEALRARKRLAIVPDANHNDVMTDEVWQQTEAWLETELEKSGLSFTDDPTDLDRRRAAGPVSVRR